MFSFEVHYLILSTDAIIMEWTIHVNTVYSIMDVYKPSIFRIKISTTQIQLESDLKWPECLPSILSWNGCMWDLLCLHATSVRNLSNEEAPQIHSYKFSLGITNVILICRRTRGDNNNTVTKHLYFKHQNNNRKINFLSRIHHQNSWYCIVTRDTMQHQDTLTDHYQTCSREHFGSSNTHNHY